MEYPRTGYLGYLPPELHKETQKFRRGNVPTCEPLLTIDQIQYAPKFATIQGWAQTQHEWRARFLLQINQKNIPSLVQQLKEMDLGGPGPIVLTPNLKWYPHIARLPPGVGMWVGDSGSYDVLYCNELIDAIVEVIETIR